MPHQNYYIVGFGSSFCLCLHYHFYLILAIALLSHQSSLFACFYFSTIISSFCVHRSLLGTFRADFERHRCVRERIICSRVVVFCQWIHLWTYCVTKNTFDRFAIISLCGAWPMGMGHDNFAENHQNKFNAELFDWCSCNIVWFFFFSRWSVINCWWSQLEGAFNCIQFIGQNSLYFNEIDSSHNIRITPPHLQTGKTTKKHKFAIQSICVGICLPVTGRRTFLRIWCTRWDEGKWIFAYGIWCRVNLCAQQLISFWQLVGCWHEHLTGFTVVMPIDSSMNVMYLYEQEKASLWR